jgi:glycosyltransferase involved in cell wall biosynthesis
MESHDSTPRRTIYRIHPKTMKNRVLIIIPAYNEEKNISILLDTLTSYRERFDAIVVDDGSKDLTAQAARERGFPVLQLPSNLGIGGAMQTGFKYAFENEYDIAVQLDGDGQHDPAWLGELIQDILSGQADCVIGSRYMKHDPDQGYKTPFLRRIGMLFSTFILFLATGKLVQDTTSGFRALDRKAFEYFVHEYPTDHPEAEALFLLHRAGFKIKEIPVKMRQRQAGTSLFSWYKSVMYPFRVLIGFMGLLLKPRK